MSESYPTRRSFLAQGALVGAALGGGVPRASAAPSSKTASISEVVHRTIMVDGVEIFYREAGDPGAPVLLLLHGFANSSHYFRHLMPRLADRFHMIAPDIPSFGFTVVPAERNYKYTFAVVSETIKKFVDALDLRKFAFYGFDYGAPIGFNLALAYPERITGIVSQNGNAYEEGLGEKGWAALRAYWKNPTQANRDAIRSRFTFEGVRGAYFLGVPDPARIEPEAYWLDTVLLARPGNDEIQLDFKLDYRANIENYPAYQAYFRKHKPPLLAIWGKNDIFFIPPGAEAFKRDLPDAKIQLLDTGHFALETHLDEIAAAIRAMPI